MRYALLIAPSSNRVYAGEAPRLTEAELAVFGEAVLGARPRNLGVEQLGGVPYVVFEVDSPLTDRDIAYLSNVSTAYALFAREGDLLRPVPLTPLARYDDDLLTILKYPGKTNEQFTQLLLNVTVLASRWADQMLERRLVVLDPLCGRGTTLNQALRYGYDAIGIEIDGGHVDAYSAFLRTWLRRKRIKHTVELNPVRHHGKRVARRLTAELAPTKEAYREKDLQHVTVFHADAVASRQLLRPGCCDVIVTDAPYGVAHGSRAATGLSRRPLELLAAAVPGWVELLRHGGALGVSFNVHVADRAEVADLLTAAGLELVTTPAYQRFAHWVDQGITRDLLVATKP
ncbi:MAG TPA: SAM-dependent methyltransferase [Natronosporangium sp.]|nr:SAM-dependent methyltransferase [Natronosporangium sp.]